MKIKKVLYRVKSPFGDNLAGDIREAYVLFSDGYTAVLFHPKDKENASGTCMCIELCKKTRYDTELGEDVYESKTNDSWLNVYSIADVPDALKASLKNLRGTTVRKAKDRTKRTFL